MIGYVAKDKDEEIYLHEERPYYVDRLECWCSNNMLNITGKFPKFEDMSYTDKPIKVEINIKKV